MTWTFTTGWLSGTGTTASMVKVRSMVGDTDSSWQLISDEEIYWLISATSANTFAAAGVCDLIAGTFARQINSENSELRVSAAARFKHYQDLAASLRDGGPGDVPGGDGSGVVRATFYVGGAKKSEKDALRSNDDLVAPTFALGSDDYPKATYDVTLSSDTLDDD